MATTVASQSVKVNIGCGLSGVPGWYNLDNSPTIALSRLPFGPRLFKTPPWPPDVRRHDVTKGLPFASGSVAYIYSSHTFEHFTYEQSLALAEECFRVLQPGGILRVVVPDLKLIVRSYLHDESAMASHNFLQRLCLNRGIRDLLHPGANHSQMFDNRSLCHLLQAAGFSRPAVCQFRGSAIPEIERIEGEERRSESLYVEALK
ncbi:MAG TPA: methyltransferase domain-containing protein [Terriglobales bacterium]|nr:methyltransferase domain-containing protein [Terriglobales bacterium]